MTVYTDRWNVVFSAYKICNKIAFFEAFEVHAFRVDILDPGDTLADKLATEMSSDGSSKMLLIHQNLGMSKYGEIIASCPQMSRSDADDAVQRIKDSFSIPESVKNMELTLAGIGTYWRQYEGFIETDIPTMPTVLCLNNEDERLVNELIPARLSLKNNIDWNKYINNVFRQKILGIALRYD